MMTSTFPETYVRCECGGDFLECEAPLSEHCLNDDCVRFHTREGKKGVEQGKQLQGNMMSPYFLENCFSDEGNCLRFAICFSCHKLLQYREKPVFEMEKRRAKMTDIDSQVKSRTDAKVKEILAKICTMLEGQIKECS